MARIALRRVIHALRGTNGDDLTPEQLARLVQLAFSGTRTIGRLLRDRRALVDHPAGDFMGVIGQAFDQLCETRDLDL
jgi:hypothetical protein